MTHLDALRLRLSNESARLHKCQERQSEIAIRRVIVAQCEKEVAGELKFLEIDDCETMSDDELTKELG